MLDATEPDDATPNDATGDLVRAIQAGASGRFSDLYERVAPALLAWAKARIAPPLAARVAAEDVLQETCLRAYRDFANYRADLGGFRRWIFGIANHVLRDALVEVARSPRSSTIEFGAGGDQLPDDATTASRRVLRNERVHALMDCIGGLNDDDRTLVGLRGCEGLRHDEVAAHLGVDVEVAKKRWQRLRVRIERAARAAGVELDD